MSDWILQLNSIWLWILIGLVLIILLGVVILSTVVRGARTPEDKAAPDQAKALPPPGADAEAAPAEERAAAESPSASFSRAIQFLRSTVSGRDYRYQIPWYLVLGDRGSGKNNLMRSVGIDLAASQRGGRGGLRWRFLDRGILIGVSGRSIGSGHAERDWNGLLRLLQNNRPRRPIDGIVLTVAASDLTGPTALDETQISGHAGRFSEMLAHAQRTLGFVFPVYVIVTRCDEIPGFSAFCRELPSRTRDDIFGWSSPYQLDASFAPEWVDEAFTGVSQDLQRLQSEILVERSELRDPDAVFLFPDEFARMRSSLGLYLERLFRETAYREAFRFRGLYFCGDISGPAEQEPQPVDAISPSIENLLPEIASAAPPQPAFHVEKSPAFVKRLFEEKIFPECGLGRPLARVSLAKSRTVSYIQAGAAVLALILLAGTWFSSRRLAGDRDRILPALQKMTFALPKSEGPEARENFGLGLLKTLDLAANVNFWSVFQPASWFSPMDDNITLVMKVACEQWVFSAIQAELAQRKGAILYPPPAPTAEASTASGKTDGTGGDDPAAPAADQSITGLDSAPEYQKLSNLVNQLRSLEDATAIYETLRQQDQSATPDRIRKLLSYLDLSDVRPSGHLALALAQATGPSAAFSPTDISTASDSVRKLIGDLLRDWFENNEAWSDVEQLRQSISDLQRGRTTTYDQLKELLALIGQVQNDFTDPNFRWLGNTSMDLPPALQRVSVNPLAGPNDVQLVSFARVQGEEYFNRLRNNLRDESTALTGGALLDLKNPIDLSSGTTQLQVALANTLNLPFMGEPIKPDPIQISLQANRRLIWRLDPLTEAQQHLVKSYNDFVQAGLRGAPDALQRSLSRLVLEQLTAHVQNLIVQAQTFQPGSSAMSGSNADQATLDEVNAFRDAAPQLEQLSEEFNTWGQAYIHNAVLRVMVLQAYNLLSTMDTRLGSEQPYAAKVGAWNGAGSLSFAVFGVTSLPALNIYLGAQRDRIKFFEQQAEPLVPFLQQYMPVQATDQTQLINKWKGIIEDFQQYASKGTTSTLTALEDFIVTGVDKIPAAACKATAPEAGADYFVQIHNHLDSQLSNRCRDVTASTVCIAYSAIAADFNGKLAGKFPFTPTATTTKNEASPDDITEFYKTVDSRGKAMHDALKASLDDDTRFGDDGRKAREFLDQIDDLRLLTIPSTPETAKEPPLAMDVVPRFRTNRAQESGGNQVIDWTMQVGGQIFQSKDPEHPGRWRSGNPIRLSLRWANDSVYAPAPDPSQPDLTIRSRNAYFEFTDKWALLAFLRRHEALPSDLGQTAEPAPYTLKFHVKTILDPKWQESTDQPATGSATVFLYLKVTPAGGKDPIRVPTIPVSAPQLATGCGPL